MKKLIFYILVTLISLQLINSILIIGDILDLQKVKAEPYTPKKTWVKAEVIQMLAEKAIENNLSPKYLINLAKCESNFNPKVRSKGYLKSGKQENSWGIFQANLDAHKNYTVEQMTDPIYNTEWAIKHIKAGKAPQMWVTCNKYASSVK